MSHEPLETPILWAQIETAIRRRPRVDPLSIELVMARVRAVEAEPARRAGAGKQLGRWFERVSGLDLRGPSALALVAASLLLAVGVVVGRFTATREAGAPSVAPVAVTPSDAREMELRPVQFVFVAKDARSVTIAGDFNDWNPVSTPMRAAGADGVWSIVLPLPPGRHLYSFVVDGRRWMPDDDAPRAPENEFGAESSVILVERGS